MIRVLIVDDSALIRQLLSHILSEDPDIKVVGVAADPLVAREKIKIENPDVITLDVEMPKMDGLSFLERIMRLRPMPVVMVSTLTQKGADVTFRALEMGAVDFIGKPTIDVETGWQEKKDELITKVKAAARARVQSRGNGNGNSSGTPKKKIANIGFRTTDKVVAIGASTGGVDALREVVCALPADSPPVLITQHMPPAFTARFAERLDTLSAVAVSEASDNARVMPGHVYIAPGDKHLKLSRSGANYVCKLWDGPLVTGHKPSVDVLFESVADIAGENAVAAILTGMGKDGGKGMLMMREAGAMTIGQDEATSLVYGMPRVAFEMGGVQEVLPLNKIAECIVKHSASRA